MGGSVSQAAARQSRTVDASRSRRNIPLLPRSLWVSLIPLSRFSLPYLFPYPFFRRVLHCVCKMMASAVRSYQIWCFISLTPQGFRRYSSSNLCPALSSPGRQSRRANGGGTLLVNRAIQRWLVVQFGEEASQTRDYCVARNATLRAARPDPSLRKERLLQDDNQTAPLPSTWSSRICVRELPAKSRFLSSFGMTSL